MLLCVSTNVMQRVGFSVIHASCLSARQSFQVGRDDLGSKLSLKQQEGFPV